MAEERKKLKFPPEPLDLSELPELPDPVKFAEQATGAIEKITRGIETLDQAFTRLDQAFGLRSRPSESDKIKSLLSEIVGEVKGKSLSESDRDAIARRIVEKLK